MPTAVITGANTGLGFETARGLLSKGYRVVITSRDGDRALRAIAKLNQEFPNSRIHSLALDLSKMSSIDSFASEFAARFGHWDLLVNNAGAKVLSKYDQTDFGVEYHFGVNAVGHFALTMDLLPHRNPEARMVSVASIVARFAPKRLGPPKSATEFSPGGAYAASKLSNLLFAIEADRKMQPLNVSSVAAHPGFARAEPYGPKATRFFESFLAQSAQAGAEPIIASANLSIPGGSYLGPKVLELWGEPKSAKIPDSVSSGSLAENWDLLENLSGRKLAF
jgi:NAD(P)-dependent dehydrogenase (short-subunit alcohol dehydrogenase family)